MDAWGPDFLGPGFEARTLELLPDDEDDGAVATLVRHVPASDPGALPGTPTTPTFALLYIHGWNDYFFQTELAQQISRLGGAFYALDLRRYGRSWREGQMLGWCTSLAEYDEDLGLALSAIRADQGWETDVVLCGHSAGGLTACLWADRHPGALAALVLNSAWLELQGSELVRMVGEPVARTLALRDPRMSIPTPAYAPETLFRVTDGWLERDGELVAAALVWPEEEAGEGREVNLVSATYEDPTALADKDACLADVVGARGEGERLLLDTHMTEPGERILRAELPPAEDSQWTLLVALPCAGGRVRPFPAGTAPYPPGRPVSAGPGRRGRPRWGAARSPPPPGQPPP